MKKGPEQYTGQMRRVWRRQKARSRPPVQTMTYRWCPRIKPCTRRCASPKPRSPPASQGPCIHGPGPPSSNTQYQGKTIKTQKTRPCPTTLKAQVLTTGEQLQGDRQSARQRHTCACPRKPVSSGRGGLLLPHGQARPRHAPRSYPHTLDCTAHRRRDLSSAPDVIRPSASSLGRPRWASACTEHTVSSQQAKQRPALVEEHWKQTPRAKTLPT